MAKKNVTIDPPKSIKRKPQPALLRGILGKTLEKFGLDKDIARYQFVLHWREIMGPDLAARATPECIRNGTLVVRVASSAWAQELSFQKHVILHRLNKFMDGDVVLQDVMFYVAGQSPNFQDGIRKGR